MKRRTQLLDPLTVPAAPSNRHYRRGVAQVAAGQGTIALEVLAELPSTALLTIFVPVGGGGLIAGVVPCRYADAEPRVIIAHTSA